ncbi:hypothetical protein Fcan01_18336 [Folsomia candida]|uniref:Uncharacterized protein n=1 Tax=Folsomia candida TaxID=158441 RepID=A0A226DPR4_FOLCA|nr:hypothetical protein Fcan01_18336 [Folsomia candida]
MHLILPEGKIQKVVAKCTNILTNNSSSLLSVAELIGVLVAASPATKYGMLYTRQLEIEKSQALGLSSNQPKSTANGSSFVRESLNRLNLSAATTAVLKASKSEGTWQQYEVTYLKWNAFCEEKNWSTWESNIEHVLTLSDLVRPETEVKGQCTFTLETPQTVYFWKATDLTSPNIHHNRVKGQPLTFGGENLIMIVILTLMSRHTLNEFHEDSEDEQDVEEASACLSQRTSQEWEEEDVDDVNFTYQEMEPFNTTQDVNVNLVENEQGATMVAASLEEISIQFNWYQKQQQIYTEH